MSAPFLQVSDNYGYFAVLDGKNVTLLLFPFFCLLLKAPVLFALIKIQ